MGHPAGQCIVCFKSLIDGLNLYELIMTRDLLCADCRSLLVPCGKHFQVQGMDVYALYWYNEGMSTLMHRIKELYDESLVKVFHKDLRNPLVWKYRKCYKVCVPSSIEKTRERGFHVVMGIFKPWNLNDDFVKADVKQSLMHVEARRKIADSIELKNKHVKNHAHILLLDDVCTTGSSLKACSDLVKTAENKVSIVVLALHTSWDKQCSLTINKK